MAAEISSATPAPGRVRSSMKTFVMRLLIIEGLVGANDLDQSTTPDVVRISKLSNILNLLECYNSLNRDVKRRTSITQMPIQIQSGQSRGIGGARRRSAWSRYWLQEFF